VVIGLGGRRIAQEAALDHIAGYSIFNDATLRDYQFRTPQWTVGKNFDRTGALGHGSSLLTHCHWALRVCASRVDSMADGSGLEHEVSDL